MSSRKTYFLMIGLLILLVGGLIATAVIGNSYLKKQSASLVAAKLDQQSLNEQQTALIKAKKDLQKYSDLQNIARAIVPQDKDQAKAVREIVRFANESGVGVESITFDDSTLGQKPTAPVAVAGEGQAQPSKPTSSSVTQAKPVPDIPGVFSVPIVITSTKNTNQFSNFINFLSKLENNRRTAQVEKVSITPGSTPNGKGFINFSLTVNIFVKP